MVLDAIHPGTVEAGSQHVAIKLHKAEDGMEALEAATTASLTESKKYGRFVKGEVIQQGTEKQAEEAGNLLTVCVVKDICGVITVHTLWGSLCPVDNSIIHRIVD